MVKTISLLMDLYKELRSYLNSKIPAGLKPWLRRGLVVLVIFFVLFGISVVGLVQMVASPAGMIKRGDQAYWQSHFVEAERSYEKALDTARLRPQQTLAYTRLCRLYRTQGKLREALSMCQASVQADRTNSQAEAELARTFSVLGDYDDAVNHARKACELDAENASAFASLSEAMVYAEKAQGSGKFDQALEMAQYAYSLEPSNPEVLHILGFLFQMQGKLDEAFAYYQHSSQTYPNFFAFYVDLGGIEQTRMNLGTSLEFFQRALALYPESVPALQGRGWTWSLTGDYDQAKQDFLQALRYDPLASESWAGLGWVYLRLENTAEARRSFDQSLALNPENLNALAGLDSLDAMALASLPLADAPSSVSQIPATVPESVAPPAPTILLEPVPVETNNFSEAASAAVMVYAFNDQMDIVSACSGAVIASRGVFLTTAHCLGHRESGILYSGQGLVGIGLVRDFHQPPEKLLRAKVVQADFLLDVAVLEVVGDWQGNPLLAALNLPALKIGDSDTLQVGDEVWTVGFPGMGGDTLTITRGVISGFSERDGLSWIKTDLMTGPGNSGGMVLNDRNELIGIHIQSWSDTGEASSRLSAERPLNVFKNLFEPYLIVHEVPGPPQD